MMANYFDNDHIDGKQLTPQQIADAIRHKKFGVDVREAMAQGLEYCMTQAQKVDKLEQDLNNLDKRVTSLETLPSEVAEIKQDIETINQNIETIDKRVTSLETLPSEVAEIKQDIETINQNIETIDKRVTSLETLPSEVAEIKQDIGTINDEINRLNLAVFGDGAVPIDTQINSNDKTNKAQEVHLD